MFRELELMEPVAQGGSSVVWFARHAHTRHPLAVKFLRREWVSRSEILLAEAEALSRLDHRHVTTIYDVGVLSETILLGDGSLSARTPYIVMEWADQGTSMMHCGRWERGHLVTVLEQTLGALAHIHARDLFHLDIKPSNVLLTRDESLEHAEVRVVDMGLWSLRDDDGEATFGTPGYMAPERRASAAADVYGVGMMALALSGYVLPKTHDSAALEQILVEFSPEWRSWLERCVARAPEARFSSAALAREALMAIATSRLSLPLSVQGSAVIDEVDTTAYSTVIDTELGAMTLSQKPRPLPADPHEVAPNADVLSFAEVPALPQSWQLPHPPRPIRRLAGVGGGVFAQRALRYIGQAEAREQLWQLLRRAEANRLALPACICGEKGSGRGALAAWFGYRVAELSGGCFVDVSAVQGRRRLESYLDVIDALDARDGVFPEELVGRVRSLREAIVGYATGGRVLVEEWQLLEVCRASIAALAQRQRVVLHLRGVSPSSAWEALLTSLRDSPLEVRHGVVVLATRVDEDVEGLFETRVKLDPLSPREIAALVNQSLGLDPLVIDELARRSRGNPGDVRELVLTWLRRGWLVAGPKGLTLGSWEEPWLSPEASNLVARTEALLAASDATERRALAAVVLVEQAPGVSESVRSDALAHTLTALGLAWPTTLYEQFLLEGRASRRGRREGGRESLPRLDEEVLSALDVALDQELSSRDIVTAVSRAIDPTHSSARATTFRLWSASTLARAGEGEGALALLRRSLIAGLDPEVAARCLELVEQLEALAIIEQEHVRVELLLLRARALFALGDHDADQVLDAAGTPDASAPLPLRFAYHEMRLIALLGRGQFSEAKAIGSCLEEMLDEAPTRELRARIHAGLARLNIHTKNYPGAVEHAGRGSALCEELDEPLIELSVRNMYAIALQESGEHGAAEPQLERCYNLAKTLGSSRFQVMTLNSLGDLALRRKRWSDARRWLREGLEVGQQSYPLAAYLHGNLAWAALNEEDADVALEHIEEALSRLADEPSIVRAYLIELEQYALAMLNMASAWDACMTRLEAMLDHIDAAHEEGVIGARASARLWEARGEKERAERALAVATQLASAFE